MTESRPLPVPASRTARLTRLGSMTARIAGNMALGGMGQLSRGKRPNMRDLLLTPANVGRITDELAKMRGAAMKIGQLMSMDTGDVLPPELAEVMGRLRQDAHFMPPAQLKQVLNAEWPAGWLGHFQKFDVRPIAAASIGQVHRAQTKDGRDLAIKVQYPGVAQSIDSDVANVGALMRMSGLLPKGFDIRPYLDAARAQLHEETDYGREGTCLSQFGDLLAHDARFIVPVLSPDWTTQNILAMTFVAGISIEETLDLPQDRRNLIAADLIDLLLHELFTFGTMQTDPNFANYRYDRANGKIILLDFGATRAIDPVIAAQYRALIRAGLASDRDALRSIALDIGFFDETTQAHHQDIILDMMMLVFDALQDPFDFTDPALSREVQRKGMILGDAGFIPPALPIDVLYLQRKFGGIFLLAARLKAQLPLRTILSRWVRSPD